MLDIGQANSDKHCVVVYLLAQGHAVDMIDLMGNLVFNSTRFLLTPPSKLDHVKTHGCYKQWIDPAKVLGEMAISPTDGCLKAVT